MVVHIGLRRLYWEKVQIDDGEPIVEDEVDKIDEQGGVEGL